MSAIEVRPFRRSDRDQLTVLVNAHTGAVIPGMSVSVHTVLSDLEGRPAEFITDPWVSDRATLVAEQGGRVAAAAHLLRYFSDDRAGAESMGSHALVRWIVERIRNRCGRRAGYVRAWFGDIRIHSDARGFLRCHRTASNLWIS